MKVTDEQLTEMVRTGLLPSRPTYRKFTPYAKWCSRCKAWRPSEQFSRAERSASGLSDYCRQHTSECNKKSYRRVSGEARAWRREQARLNKALNGKK